VFQKSPLGDLGHRWIHTLEQFATFQKSPLGDLGAKARKV